MDKDKVYNFRTLSADVLGEVYEGFKVTDSLSYRTAKTLRPDIDNVIIKMGTLGITTDKEVLDFKVFENQVDLTITVMAEQWVNSTSIELVSTDTHDYSLKVFGVTPIEVNEIKDFIKKTLGKNCIVEILG